MMIAMFTLLLVVSGVNTEQDQLMERREEERGGVSRAQSGPLCHFRAGEGRAMASRGRVSGKWRIIWTREDQEDNSSAADDYPQILCGDM